jgi:ribosomal protein S27E
MNRHYDNYLIKKYAPLYRDRYGDLRSTAMCWGFECGDGWFNLIDTLSFLLCSEWLAAKDNYERMKDREGKPEWDAKFIPDSRIITADIIEEYRKKMQEAYDKTPIATQVKEKYGTLRFYAANTTDIQNAYIDFAESMSAVTCEVCGAKGKRSHYGWITTRCKEHQDD